jgi:hypothetical protein
MTREIDGSIPRSCFQSPLPLTPDSRKDASVGDRQHWPMECAGDTSIAGHGPLRPSFRGPSDGRWAARETGTRLGQPGELECAGISCSALRVFDPAIDSPGHTRMSRVSLEAGVMRWKLGPGQSLAESGQGGRRSRQPCERPGALLGLLRRQKGRASAAWTRSVEGVRQRCSRMPRPRWSGEDTSREWLEGAGSGISIGMTRKRRDEGSACTPR